MTLTKRVGLGVTLGCDPAGGSSYTVLGSIVDAIDGPGAKGTVYETALLTDKFTTKGVAQVDPGEVTFTIAYDPGDSTTTTLTGLLKSGALAGWQITYPVVGAEAQQKEPFQGAVSGFKRGVQKAKMITAEVTIAVSGNPGFTGGT